MRASIVVALMVSSTGCQHVPAVACSLEAFDLARFLGAMDLERGPVGLRGVEVPLRDDLADRTGTDAATVYLTPDGILLAPPRGLLPGVEAGCDVPELDRCFARLYERSEEGFEVRRRHGDPRRLYFVVDRAVRWDRLVPIVAAAHQAGFESPAFLFARTPAIPPPPRTWVDDDFDRFDDDERLAGDHAAEIGRIAEAVLTCDAFKEGFHAAGDMPWSTYMILRAPQQVVECHCALDLTALRSFMWHLLGTAHPVTVFDFTLSPSAAPLELPAATPWGDASTRLSAQPTWFVVADPR